MSTPCKECGYPLEGNETFCPECGCPVENQSNAYAQVKEQPAQPSSHKVQNPTPAPAYPAPTPTPKTDWAQYFYECGVIGWEAFKKYCVFTGRASRREYWSFYLLFLMIVSVSYGIGLLICILPLIGVSIRRMHDVGKCGWWSICPFACFFLLFKRSDDGANFYGAPNPAKNLL